MTLKELAELLADKGIAYPYDAAIMVADYMDGTGPTVLGERMNIPADEARRVVDRCASAMGVSLDDLRTMYEIPEGGIDPRDDVEIMRDAIRADSAQRDAARIVARLAVRDGQSVWGWPAHVRDVLECDSIQHAQQRLEELAAARVVRFGRPLDSRGRLRWGVTLCV
jgi:hypothetical protein